LQNSPKKTSNTPAIFMPVINTKKARETIARIEALQGPIANASAPTPADAVAAAKSVSSTLDGHAATIATQKASITALNAKVDDLMSKLRELKASKAPASAIARAAETATRKTANDLAAVRRDAAPAKPAALTAAAWIAANAGPSMSRAEFDRLSHPQRNEFIRTGGKLI
jgi:hypothetical protein